MTRCHVSNILTNEKRSLCSARIDSPYALRSTATSHFGLAAHKLKCTEYFAEEPLKLRRTVQVSRSDAPVPARVTLYEPRAQPPGKSTHDVHCHFAAQTRPGQEASISYGVFLDTAPGPSKLHFYIFFGRQSDQRSSDHRSCVRTGEYARYCCRCDPPNSKTITVRAVVHLQAERDASFVQNAGLQLMYAVNTHCHADHITGTGALKRLFPSVKSVVSHASGCTADMHVKPGDKVQLHVERLLNSLCECCMRFFSTLCFKTACGLSLLT